MALHPDFVDILELPPTEPLQLAEDFQNSLMPRKADLPIPEWGMKETRERQAGLDANPASGLTPGKKPFAGWSKCDAEARFHVGGWGWPASLSLSAASRVRIPAAEFGQSIQAGCSGGNNTGASVAGQIPRRLWPISSRSGPSVRVLHPL